jgi:DNA polymerase III subunit epsilon
LGDYSVVVLDFETTGLSPDNGDRAIEIGAVFVRNNEIVDRFQRLMNPGKRLSGKQTSLPTAPFTVPSQMRN